MNAGDKELSEGWTTCFNQFAKFPNLSDISLIFSPKCTSPETDGWEYPESVEFRTALLHRLFELLNQAKAVGVCALSIVHLQNLNHEDITSSDNFQQVLRRLQSLKIHIATEQDERKTKLDPAQ